MTLAGTSMEKPMSNTVPSNSATADDVNPYQAPELHAPSAFEDEQPVRLKTLIVCWIVVLALNSILPAWIAASIIDNARAGAGVAAAMLTLLAGGTLLCIRQPQVMWTLVVGGAITATFQPIPILQVLPFIAGAIAMGLADWLGIASNDLFNDFGIRLFSGGYFVAVVTAIIMATAAACIGFVVRMIIGRRSVLGMPPLRN